MSSVTLTPSKRKIIDLNEDTFKTLSIMAIQKGTNLKKYIEDVLNELAENYEDAKLYAKLSKENPDGNIMLNEQEKADLENWLCVLKLITLKSLKNL